MSNLHPRIYVIDPDDTEAKIRAIADIAEGSLSKGFDLLVSLDGLNFYDVLYKIRESGPDYHNGRITQPAVELNRVAISFADGKMTCDDRVYTLDSNAAMAMTIFKPIMRVVELVETHLGYYVVAQDLITGMSHDFLDGEPLCLIPGSGMRARSGDLVADSQYVGHRYLVRGDHMDVSRQTATFDDKPATVLDPKDYVVTFVDDLSSATITKK